MTPEQRKVYEEWVDTLPVKDQIRYSCDQRCMTSFLAGWQHSEKMLAAWREGYKSVATSAGVTDADRAGWNDEVNLLPKAE